MMTMITLANLWLLLAEQVSHFFFISFVCSLFIRQIGENEEDDSPIEALSISSTGLDDEKWKRLINKSPITIRNAADTIVNGMCCSHPSSLTSHFIILPDHVCCTCQ
jgi:hypothetical protein